MKKQIFRFQKSSYGLFSRLTDYNRSFVITVFMIMLLGFIFFTIYFTNLLLEGLKKEAQIVPRIYAKFMQNTSLLESTDLDAKSTEIIFEEIVRRDIFPIILTNENDEIISWKIKDFPQRKFEELNREEKDMLHNLLEEMDRYNTPVKLELTHEDKKLFRQIHYSESESISKLRYVPFVQASVLLGFILVAVLFLSFIREQEKRQLWVSLAKEIAHQFGTPISSLMGWVEILKLKDTKNIDIINNLEADTNRLRKIADRFGKIGSDIKFREESLSDIIEGITEYFRQRLSSPGIVSSKVINIFYRKPSEDIKLYCSKELLEWIFENLIKNSVTAMTMDDRDTAKEINIKVKSKSYGNEGHSIIDIYISDTGPGIPQKKQSRIFEPGFTTKRRGWGLGLTLSKRIAEEYHYGRLRLIESSAKNGTTFCLSLNTKHLYDRKIT